MSKLLFIPLVLWLALWSAFGVVWGESLTVAVLIEEGGARDGETVTVQVEAIGDKMARENHFWINGLDSTGAIGLWMPSALAGNIQVMGDGKHVGDRLEATGVFHRSCIEHGGDMDVHVQQIRILEAGYERKNPITEGRVAVAILLSGLTVLVGGIYLRTRC